jgi:hypothetical protein
MASARARSPGGSPTAPWTASTCRASASCSPSGTATTSRVRRGRGCSTSTRAALEEVFTGRLGGTPLSQFPWAFKPSSLLAVVPCRIEIDHTPGRGWFRAGSNVTVRITAPHETQSPVTCVIPGHHRTGREVVAEELDVRNEHFDFAYSGRCGYETTFEYSSEQAAT